VWVKDETHNVSGSHKARHLVTILLHLLAAEAVGLRSGAERPALAIASCGNAALAAATLAAASSWPIEVFVPPSARPAVVERLVALAATVTVCPRREGDPAGDPCVLRFREAVAAGAVPFSVQGPENALCLDTGRTIGFEMLRWWETHGPSPWLDRWFVQVGGGALAACVGRAAMGAGVHPRLHAVQTEGCAPLARAQERAGAFDPGTAAQHWAQCMWPWEREPVSAASGILDDETYDWVSVLDALVGSGGSAVVAPESAILAANELAVAKTAIPVDHTGSAGLAGLLAIRSSVADDETVAVIFSGRRR
jgi:threonine synthase